MRSSDWEMQVDIRSRPPALPPFDLITGADTRSALLAAAVDSFAVKGFHGTTTRDIASAVGLSPASMYVHFPSKEDVLYTISRAGHELSLRIVEESIAVSDDPVEQLGTMVYNFTAHHGHNQRVARVVTTELESLAPEHLDEVMGIRREIQKRIHDLLRSGASSGHFDCPDPSLTANMISSLGIDVARWYREGGRWTPEEIADHYREATLRLVRRATTP